MTSILFPGEQQLSTAKILILDDEQAHVRVLEWALKQAKFCHLLSITDSTLARAEFARFQPDLVLLDWNMPQIDGLGVLRQIQEILPSDSFVPVLILTGESNAEVRTKALAAGAHDFLRKPLDYSEVMLRVRNLLRTRFLFRQVQELKAQLDLATGATPAQTLKTAKQNR